MNQDKDILTRLNHSDGMTVPKGYFADFGRRMEAALPDRPELTQPESVVVPRTWWQRVRPYAYMAAMFAGVWCMLKMFTLMSSGGQQPLETNPIMAEAFANDTFVNEYVLDDVSQWDIYDEMIEDGIDAEAFCDSLEQLSQLQIQ
ncbi:MAG: hypothetical protein Q4C34_04815 [Bacteroidales bacterium]|nr:hypothetical protein [Bacteroidales bacterium]